MQANKHGTNREIACMSEQPRTASTSDQPDADVAGTVTRGVARLLADLGFASLTEVSLRNGRRVDLMGIARDGKIAVVEVKSSVNDYRTDQKWQEYLEYCDFFYFAVPEGFPVEILPAEPGLMVADRFAGAILRPAPEVAMNGTRRRNVTLRFARAAADRLTRLV